MDQDRLQDELMNLRKRMTQPLNQDGLDEDKAMIFRSLALVLELLTEIDGKVEIRWAPTSPINQRKKALHKGREGGLHFRRRAQRGTA